MTALERQTQQALTPSPHVRSPPLPGLNVLVVILCVGRSACTVKLTHRGRRELNYNENRKMNVLKVNYDGVSLLQKEELC